MNREMQLLEVAECYRQSVAKMRDRWLRLFRTLPNTPEREAARLDFVEGQRLVAEGRAALLHLAREGLPEDGMSSRHRKWKRAKLAREAEVKKLTDLLASYDAVIADLRNCGVVESELMRIQIARSVLNVHLEEERKTLAAMVLPP